jgi:hypothetical protein
MAKIRAGQKIGIINPDIALTGDHGQFLGFILYFEKITM